MNQFMMIVYEYGCGYGFGHGDGYRYDDRLCKIHNEDVDWTCIPDLVWTCETLLTQGLPTQTPT